ALQVGDLALEGRDLELQALDVLVDGEGREGRGHDPCNQDCATEHCEPPRCRSYIPGRPSRITVLWPVNAPRSPATERVTHDAFSFRNENDREMASRSPRYRLPAHDEVRAAVPGPRLVVAGGIERLLLAVCHRPQAISRDPETDQVFARRPGALGAQRAAVI